MSLIDPPPPELTKFISSLLPACTRVMKNATRECFAELKTCLSNYDWLAYPNYAENVVQLISVPIVTLMKSRTSMADSARVEMLDCLRVITSSVPVKNVLCFLDIFNCLNLLFDPPDITRSTNDIKINPDLSEEALGNLELALQGLLCQSLQIHRKSLFDPKAIHSVGHCIYMQLQVVSSDVPVETRLTALDIIDLMLESAGGQTESSQSVFQFFPGLIVSLCAILKESGTRIRKYLKIRSCEVLKTSIVNCLGPQDPSSLAVVDERLFKNLTKICDKVSLDEDEQMRRSILEMAISCVPLFEEKGMEQCLKLLRDYILVSCSEDCDDTTRQYACDFLLANSSTCRCDFDDCAAWLRTSHRKLVANDDEECVKKLRSFCGSFYCRTYTTLEISTLLPVVVHLWNSAVLKYGYQYEMTSNGVVSISKHRILRELDRPTACIGTFTGIDNLVDEITNFLAFGSKLPLEDRYDLHFTGCIAMLTSLLKSSPGVSSLVDVLQNFTEMLIDVLELNEHERDQVTLPKLLSIMDMEVCLLLECLQVLTSISRDYLLPYTIYHFMKYAGKRAQDGPVLASRLALQSLSNGVTEEDFLRQQLDVFLPELVSRVSCVSSNPWCSNAVIYLANLFDFSRPEFVGLIELVLTQSCDQFYFSMQLPFVHMLHAFLRSLYQHHHSEENMEGSPSTKPVDESLEQRLLKYQASIGITEGLEEGPALKAEKSDDDESEAQSTNEDQIKVDPISSLIVSICERLLNFLPSTDHAEVQVLSMQGLTLGLFMLQGDQNLLLPLAHKIWSNLAPRFTADSYIVIQSSFQLLVALCKTSKDFLKKRVVEQIFPKLAILMKNLSKNGTLITSKTELYYTHTQEFKVQVAVLEGLVDLVISVDANEEDTDKIIDYCCMYLNPSQHIKLREAAKSLLLKFAESDKAEVFWMKLLKEGVLPPPKTDLDGH